MAKKLPAIFTRLSRSMDQLQKYIINHQTDIINRQELVGTINIVSNGAICVLTRILYLFKKLRLMGIVVPQSDITTLKEINSAIINASMDSLELYGCDDPIEKATEFYTGMKRAEASLKALNKYEVMYSEEIHRRAS